MSNSEHFRRQADICLRLSLDASSEYMAARFIAMAKDYHAKADALEAEPRGDVSENGHRRTTRRDGGSDPFLRRH